MAAPAKSTPRDAQIIAAILKDMGVVEYEPRVINQMLEFAYRYITDILDDAKVYSTHANKKNIDTDDVKLAIQCRMDNSFTAPPPRDLLMEISRYKNSQPLPLIKPYSGPRLPPDRYCLFAPNYRLKTHKKTRIQIGLPMSQFQSNLAKQRISLASVHPGGANAKVGIINPTLTVVSKGMSIPTVTIVTKPSTPTVSTVPKPTIRFSTGISGGMGAASSIGMSAASSIGMSAASSIGMSAASSIGKSPSLSTTSAAPNSITSSFLPTTHGLSGGFNPLKRKLEADDDYDKL